MTKLPANYPEPVWTGKWICAPFAAADGLDRTELFTSRGAPWVRTVFDCAKVPKDAILYVAAPGWCEVHVNGNRVGEQVLSPVVTQLTERTSYLCLAVGKLLKHGRNAIAVLLGNGWYQPQTKEVWEFHFAPWRNEPSLLLQLEDGAGNVLAASGAAWKGAPSFITMNALRNGESQDTRMGMTAEAVSQPDYDDSAWQSVAIANPPPGRLTPEECEPCVVAERIPVAAANWRSEYCTVYDFGRNLTGWCEVEVEGPAGSKAILEYGERLRASGDLDTEEIKVFVKSGGFQRDQYILNGRGRQKLHPHFTYHGFRYVRFWTTSPEVKVHKVTACFIHNAFRQAGSFTTSHAALNWLQQTTAHTYLCNFTGIPTDCPHREKNGWTGDANLALETGLWNFDTRLADIHFGRVLMDAQRPSGQLPGIAPTGGWGFNWGNGPAWDSYIFEDACQLWQFYGDDTLIREQYDRMAKYLDYCRWHDTDGVADFGLGDWCPPYASHAPEAALTSTGFYYLDVRRMQEFARHLGRTDDLAWWETLANRIRDGFNARYAQADGGCANNSVTALAASLHFGFSPTPQKTLGKLLKLLKKENYIADFGILGAKFTPRVLGETGHLKELFKLFTQNQFPGWIHWMEQGATTLWEEWNGNSSQMHIMFGDTSACIYRYFAGIRPTAPAFAKITLKPAVDLPELPDFDCEYAAPQGKITSRLETVRGKRKYTCSVPQNIEATLELPGRSPAKLPAGKETAITL
ncbi:MAG: family 78 glycoside hydrolase catalytic domain [Victivallales bacterium]|nr:family 78 glycoside hydrolase catalytic domain [Victivallales bacterium]